MIISKKKDAFGQFLMACYKNEKPYQLIERDDGYIDASSSDNLYFTQYNNWSKHEKAAMKYASGRVLDIGCGTGRHALYLQNNKLNVLGIDNSPLAVKVCKLRGLKNVKILALNETSQFNHNTFKTVMMLGNNFGLFGSFNNAKRMLKVLYKITSSDGLIIAESTNPYKTKDSYHLSYHNLNKKRGRMAGQLKIRVRYKTYIGEWFDYLLVSKSELIKILEGTGWRIRKFINSGKAQYIMILEK